MADGRRGAALDLFRLAAVMLVVANHTSPLVSVLKCSPSQGQNHLTHCGSIPAGCSPVEMYS